ncbi:hypothetical protein [Fusibacter sp. JL216-2]
MDAKLVIARNSSGWYRVRKGKRQALSYLKMFKQEDCRCNLLENT